jgi:threonine/homoserine/homoserine lactone efflux protein
MSLLFGFLTGFVASIPLGPISILVINKTLQGKFKKMLYFSLSVMVIDIVLAGAILFGLAEVFKEESAQRIIIISGSILILLFSVVMIKKPVKLEMEDKKDIKLAQQEGLKTFFTGLIFCAGNLNLIPSWIVFLSYLIAIEKALPYISFSETNLDKAVFSIFCGIGTYAWYYLLIRFFNKKKNFFNKNILKKINLYTGIFLMILALYWLIGTFLKG